MLPHDELYHYGVKGMKWDQKKAKQADDDEKKDRAAALERLKTGKISRDEYRRLDAYIVDRYKRERNVQAKIAADLKSGKMTQAQYDASFKAHAERFAKAKQVLDRLTGQHANKKLSKKDQGRHLDSYNNSLNKVAGKTKGKSGQVQRQRSTGTRKDQMSKARSRSKAPTVPKRLWNNGPNR